MNHSGTLVTAAQVIRRDMAALQKHAGFSDDFLNQLADDLEKVAAEIKKINIKTGGKP